MGMTISYIDLVSHLNLLFLHKSIYRDFEILWLQVACHTQVLIALLISFAGHQYLLA